MNQIKSITLGAHDFSANSNDRNRQVVSWGSINPTNFHVQIIENDIIIITLWPSVNYTGILNGVSLKHLVILVSHFFPPITDYVQPACLPFANEPDHVSDPVVLAGWGDYITGGKLYICKSET